MPVSKKPIACQGCPLYGDGWGYVSDSVPKNNDPKLIIVRDMPSKKSRESGIAGTSGEIKGWRARVAPMMGLDARKDVSIAHILRCQYYNGKDYVSTPPKAAITNPAVEHCRVHDRADLIQSAKVMVANGPLAWKVMSHGAGTMRVWRSFYVIRSIYEVLKNQIKKSSNPSLDDFWFNDDIGHGPIHPE